jgi:hypothetical protein
MDCVLYGIAAIAIRIHDVGTERDVILCDPASPSAGYYRAFFLRLGWRVDGLTPYLRLRDCGIRIDKLASENNGVAVTQDRARNCPQ